MKVIFDGNGAAHVGTGEGFEDGFDLPKGAGQLPTRYVLVGGTPTDLFPGLTDEEAIAELEKAAKAAQDKVAATAYTLSLQKPLSQLDFISLFTDAELAKIYQTAKSNVAVEVWLDKVKLAADVTLSDTRTRAGVNALVGFGILDADRAKAILANQELPEA